MVFLISLPILLPLLPIKAATEEMNRRHTQPLPPCKSFEIFLPVTPQAMAFCLKGNHPPENRLFLRHLEAKASQCSILHCLSVVTPDSWRNFQPPMLGPKMQGMVLHPVKLLVQLISQQGVVYHIAVVGRRQYHWFVDFN